jgi:predicted RNA-binding protein
MHTMKKAVKFSILVFLMSTSMVFANETSPVEDFPKAMKEITAYLYEAIGEDVIEGQKSVNVVFTVNTDNEIIVLDVRTSDKEFKGYVKGILNNKELSAGDLIPGKQYTFKVVVK